MHNTKNTRLVDVCEFVYLAFGTVKSFLIDVLYACLRCYMVALFSSLTSNKTLIRWGFLFFQSKSNSNLKSSASGRLSLQHIGICCDYLCTHVLHLRKRLMFLCYCYSKRTKKSLSDTQSTLFTNGKGAHLHKVCLHACAICGLIV